MATTSITTPISSSTVTEGNTLVIKLGGVAYDTTINWGEVKVCSGGSIVGDTTGTILYGGINAGGYSRGYLRVYSGGIAKNTTVNSGGKFLVYGPSTGSNPDSKYGGTASNTTVNSAGFMSIGNGGKAFDTLVTSGGSLIILTSGTAINTTVETGGIMTLSGSATISSGLVNSGSVVIGSQGAGDSVVSADTIDTKDGTFTAYGKNITLTGINQTPLQLDGKITLINSSFGMNLSAMISGGTTGGTIEAQGMVTVKDSIITANTFNVVDLDENEKSTIAYAELKFTGSNTLNNVDLTLTASIITPITTAGMTTVEGTLTVTNSTLTTNKWVTNNGTITMNSGSTITADSVTTGGTINATDGTTMSVTGKLSNSVVLVLDDLPKTLDTSASTPYTVTISDGTNSWASTSYKYNTYQKTTTQEAKFFIVDFGSDEIPEGSYTVTITKNSNSEVIKTYTNYSVENAAINLTGSNISAASVTNACTITMDAKSKITAGSIKNNGSITVDPTNYDGSVSMKKVIDLTGTETAVSGNDVGLTSGAAPGYLLYHREFAGTTTAERDYDYYLVDVGQSTVYVDSDWTIGAFGVTAKLGEASVEKRYSLYNAFNTVNTAVAEAASLGAELVIQDGADAYDEIIELRGVKTTILSGTGTTEFNKAVYGGTKVTAGTGLTRNTDVTIQTGTFNKFFVGGGNIEMGTSTTSYTVTGTQTQSVNISGGVFNAIVAGGDRFRQGNFTLDGNINMNVSGGTFTTCLAGGLLNSTAGIEKGNATIKGNVNLTITGGTFAEGCWIYGGCVSSKKEKTISVQTEIEGNVTVTVNATTTDINLCSIVAGSHGWGKITREDGQTADEAGNAKLVFTGIGSKIHFTEDAQIWGSSSGDDFDYQTQKVTESSIDGSRILSFTGFNGAINCTKIRGFTDIEFAGNSTVELNNGGVYNLSGVENWTFEKGSTLTGDFTNDFTGDTLNLKGFSSLTGSVTLITDLNATNGKDVFHGFGAFGFVTLEDIGAATKQSDTLYYWGTSDAHTYELEINSNQMVLTKIA